MKLLLTGDTYFLSFEQNLAIICLNWYLETQSHLTNNVVNFRK